MRMALQNQGVATINRAIDSTIITELGQATQDTGTATTMSLDLIMRLAPAS